MVEYCGPPLGEPAVFELLFELVPPSLVDMARLDTASDENARKQRQSKH
jgi:hypothetical protein